MGADGAVSHVGVMTRDVTAQVEQRQELEAVRSEILAAEKELAAQRETITAPGLAWAFERRGLRVTSRN